MSRSLDARLLRLKQRFDPPPNFLVIFRTEVDSDEPIREPRRFESSDGQHAWERGPDETAEAFEQRVHHDARRITKGGAFTVIGIDARGL